ncbi:alpha/beta fold hydrolase [Edwardsiella piscicida]|uniref:alpha/beta fold hydrolase n=1 Tax=Edwardsiella piscicida TaxID=1263550 RepID=UPI00084BFF46|nr:alpha/beta fold hydrolase [Edwardsiella piscicida]AOP41746.1 alpha/beta hydrolase [Edwardsiella piscicida]EKS7767978.1 alpha/beta fold hydrolase [Edwardsiella piscicida]UCQ31496.1 alpha/beta hydrolase [Edwardsiella piscicida]UCQ57821.1 alpha/beta hydrolase [Edwardsiella piscicida]
MIERAFLVPGMAVREFRTEVPLNWRDPSDGRRLTLFARELCAPGREADEMPCLLFLQGGPGGKCPRPTSHSGWLAEALRDYRVILMDQRGTGNSSRIEASVLRDMTPEQAADYLSHFRADAIVRDAEHLRLRHFGGRRWTTLGQSYGGFITLTYLSQAPQGLYACYITGGLPAIAPDATRLYEATYRLVAQRNQHFFTRYPQAREQLDRIVALLREQAVYLPDGDLLSVERLLTLGLDMGMSEGYERLLWLLDEAFNQEGELSDTFLNQVMQRSGFADNPLYAVLHESIYADADSGATRWAAQRVRDDLPAFSPERSSPLLTGEMIYPWMFDQMQSLRPFRAAVELLARRETWPVLYDAARLRDNDIPVMAAVYYHDMYVDVGLSLESAAQIGNLQTWITSEYDHNGLRVAPVFRRLRDMMADRGVATE